MRPRIRAGHGYIAMLLLGLMLGVLLDITLHPLNAIKSLAQGQPGCFTFAETQKTVCGRFLEYWQTHGGLAQQGYPISSELQEVSSITFKPLTVQYFERAVFEYHPEFAGTPNEVLLALLGTEEYHRRYPNTEPPPVGLPSSTPDTRPRPVGTAPPVASPTVLPTKQPTPTATPAEDERCGAICNDGTVVRATAQGACTGHDKVKEWLRIGDPRCPGAATPTRSP